MNCKYPSLGFVALTIFSLMIAHGAASHDSVDQIGQDINNKGGIDAKMSNADINAILVKIDHTLQHDRDMKEKDHDILLRDKIQLLMKKNKNTGGKDSASLQEALAALKALNNKKSEEYFYDQWTVNWALLKSSTKSNPPAPEWQKDANAGLAAVLNNPNYLFEDTLKNAEEFLNDYKDATLSATLAHRWDQFRTYNKGK